MLVFYSRTLGLSPAVIGFVYSAGSVGGIVGAVAAPWLGRRFTAERTALLASPMRGIGVALIPLAAYAGPIAVPLLVLARLINATGWSVWDVHQQTLLQLSIPDSLRVRVTGSSLFAVRTADAVGSFAGAGFAALIGVVPTLVTGGIGAVAAAVWLWPIGPGGVGCGRAGSAPGRRD